SRLLEADESGIASSQGIELHRKWSERKAETLMAGSAPTITVRAATEIARTKAIEPSDEIQVEEVARTTDRPHSAAFGKLVHESILRVPFGATQDHILSVTAQVARILGAAEADARAAAAVVTRAMTSPSMREAAVSTMVHREYPILCKIEDGTLVEGIADLAFLSGTNGSAGWTVLDFKTDWDIHSRMDEYRKQLALYLRGISILTGTPARGVLLWI